MIFPNPKRFLRADFFAFYNKAKLTRFLEAMQLA